jgi:5-formyltetrahydrofolate cyclo-ligase
MSRQTADPITQARRALRTTLRERRRALPAAARIAAAQGLAAQLHALPFAPTRGRVAGYWAMDGEIALHAWQLSLADAIEYCLPILDESAGLLRFAPWRPGAPLEPNRFGIPEPVVPANQWLAATDLDLVVVPLVGFDAGCHRLGMGGGWYDRSLAARLVQAGPPHLAGAAFDLQRLDGIEVAPWDVPLDAVCTGSACYLRPSDPA